MRSLSVAAFGAAFLLSTPQAEACDRFDRNGWICPDDGFQSIKKRVSYGTHKRHSKRVRHVRRIKRAHQVRRAKRRAIAQKQKAVSTRPASSNHALIRVTNGTVGRNPTGKRYLWCQDFINQALRKAGYRATGSRAALSSLRLGRGVSNPRAGDIAVRRRGRRGGHVGIVLGVKGNKVLLRGGNQCGRRGRRVVCDRWVTAYRYRYRRV